MSFALTQRLRRISSVNHIHTTLKHTTRKRFCSHPFREADPPWTTLKRGIIKSIGWKSCAFFVVLGIGYDLAKNYLFNFNLQMAIGGGGACVCGSFSLYRWFKYMGAFPFVHRFIVVFFGTQLHSLGFEFGRLALGPIATLRLHHLRVNS